MSSFSPGRSNCFPEITSTKTANGAGLPQAVLLGSDILVHGRHAGIAEDVSFAGRPGRLFIAQSP